MIQAMTWFDWAVGGIVLLSTILSVYRGFVREAMSLAAWVVASLVAFTLGEQMSAQLVGVIENDTLRYVGACVILFLATLILGSLLNRLLGTLIKITGLSGVDREHRAANLGFWIRSSGTNRGVATIATRLVAAYGFAALDLNRIELVIAVQNAASRRVAVKAGALEEGTLRQRLVIDGRPTDCVSYSILRSEFESSGLYADRR